MLLSKLQATPHNFAWGDDGARTLYLWARTLLYRTRQKIPGIRS